MKSKYTFDTTRARAALDAPVGHPANGCPERAFRRARVSRIINGTVNVSHGLKHAVEAASSSSISGRKHAARGLALANFHHRR